MGKQLEGIWEALKGGGRPYGTFKGPPVLLSVLFAVLFVAAVEVGKAVSILFAIPLGVVALGALAWRVSISYQRGRARGRGRNTGPQDDTVVTRELDQRYEPTRGSENQKP